MQVFGFFILKRGGDALFQQADALLAYIQSREDGDQSQCIAGHDVEQGQLQLSVPKEGAGVQGEGGESGKSTKEPGKEECSRRSRKMKGLRHTPAEADEK